MNKGSSLLLLALLTMLGGTPTDGFNFTELKKVAGLEWDKAAEMDASAMNKIMATLMTTTTETPTPLERYCPENDSKVPAFLQMFPGAKTLRKPTKPVKDGSSSNDKPLILTPYIDKGEIGLAKSLARLRLFELTKIAKGYAAYITANREYNSNFFFWFVKGKMAKPWSKATLILWLQGGPGASSMFALFNEQGPYDINEKDDVYSVFERETTWAEDYNMMFVDQPAGTGFSFTKDEKGYATNEDMIADDMYEFLQQFYKLFPELQGNDLYLAGQSYAGKYVPAIANKIRVMNQKKVKKLIHLPLKGLIIGDGSIDPIRQVDYGDFLYNVGLIDNDDRDYYAEIRDDIVSDIEEKRWSDAEDRFQRLIKEIKCSTGLESVYNYLFDDMPESFDYYPEYLEMSKVREAIHVGDQPFNPQSMAVYAHLREDMMQSMADKVKILLDNDYKVMIYNGQLDVAITHRGTEKYIRDLTWKGQDDYKKATRKIWRVEGEVAGYVREVLNLRQVMVRNAGHIVPFDQPKWALDMVKRFIEGTPFGNSPGSNGTG